MILKLVYKPEINVIRFENEIEKKKTHSFCDKESGLVFTSLMFLIFFF